MQSRVSVLAVALAWPTLLATTPASADPSNFLIGKWTLSGSILDQNRPGFTCTRAGFAFAADRYGYLVDGKMTVLPVLGYDRTGEYVSVTYRNGTDSFQVIDQNTIEYTTFSIRCRYSRLPG